jgi:predicted dehydrogenase
MAYQREASARLRVGLVGAGLHAYRNLLPSLTYLPVELVAICDVDAERARSTASQYGAVAYTDPPAMYEGEQLGAVLLSVSPRLHPPLMREALEAGLHVWSEKPPALRAHELDTVIDAAGDRAVGVGFKKVFSPAIDKLSEAIERFGPLRSVLATYPIDVPEDGEGALAAGQETDLLIQGCHVLAVLRHLGGPVEAVTVTRGQRGGGVCVLEFVDGAIGTFHLGDGGPSGQPFEFYRCFLDEVHAEVENMTTVRVQRGTPMGREVRDFVPAGWDTGALVWQPQASLATLENMSLFTQGFVPELADFIDAVITGRQVRQGGSLHFAREVMSIYEAVLRSSGRRIELKAARNPGKLP